MQLNQFLGRMYDLKVEHTIFIALILKGVCVALENGLVVAQIAHIVASDQGHTVCCLKLLQNAPSNYYCTGPPIVQN